MPVSTLLVSDALSGTFTMSGVNLFRTITMADASTMSLAELRRELTRRGVDYGDCLEKDDMVKRLQDSIERGIDNSAAKAAPADGLT
eukprot:gene24438-10448_t